MGLQVARGLSAVHKAQIVHRDVKPENILVTEDDVIFLVDFGIARIAGTRGVTQVNRVVGTVRYLSPERMTGNQPDNPAGDLWSLGITFYYAITGRHPFKDDELDNDVFLPDAIRQRSPRPLGTESRLESLIMSLLDKDPAARPDAEKVIDALTTILRGTRRSASADPPGPVPSGNGQPLSEGRRGIQQGRPDEQTRQREPQTPAMAGGRQPGNAERLRGGIEGVRSLISSLGLDTAIDMLLTMHEDDAASVLGGLAVHDCASLLQGIAELRSAAAGRIFSKMLRYPGRARPTDVAHRLPANVAATILADMDPADAAQIMAQMNERAASRLVKHLTDQRAALIFGKMDSNDAAKILIDAKLTTAANVLRTDGGLATKVLRHLEEPDRHELARLIAKGRRNR